MNSEIAKKYIGLPYIKYDFIHNNCNEDYNEDFNLFFDENYIYNGIIRYINSDNILVSKICNM